MTEISHIDFSNEYQPEAPTRVYLDEVDPDTLDAWKPEAREVPEGLGGEQLSADVRIASALGIATVGSSVEVS